MEALERKAPIHFVAAFLLTSLTQAQCYEVDVIVGPICPPFFDHAIVHAEDLNESGVVTGEYTPCNGGSQGFLWTPTGGFELISTPTGVSSLGAEAMNDNGLVVGSLELTKDSIGFIPYIFDGEDVEIIGTLPGGTYGQFRDVNNSGIAVGVWGNGATGIPTAEHALLWENGELIDLGAFLPQPKSRATGINDAGTIIGKMWTGQDSESTGFIWEDGTVTALVPFTPMYSSGGAINQAGEIAGSASFINAAGTSLEFRAFHWVDGVFTITEPPKGYDSIGFADINDHGDFLAVWFNYGQDDQVYALWRNDGTVIEIDDLIPNPLEGYGEFHLTFVIALNNAGQILCSGWLKTGSGAATVGLLLTPIDTTGDVTGDCRVDALDLGELLKAW
jgi:uncharacterized membrane protein